MSEELESGVWASVKETIKTIVYALLIAGTFRTLFFQPFWIPSGSMKDTLLVGDFLFVNKMAYGYSYASCPSIKIPSLGVDIDAEDFCGVFKGAEKRFLGSEPEVGDVIVFRHPVTGVDFVKRLVGVPGDRIQMIEGVLHINGAPVEVERVADFEEIYAPQGGQNSVPRCSNTVASQGDVCIKERYEETFPNGVKHSILNIGIQRADDTGSYTVPDGHYFFMGDNRDNSMDSRFAQSDGGVGYVAAENIVGRADRIVFSSAGRSMLAFWTWRMDRFFKAVN